MKGSRQYFSDGKAGACAGCRAGRIIETGKAWPATELAKFFAIALGCPFSERVISGSPMNYSQMKDERLMAFYEAVRQQVILDGKSRYRFAGEGVKAYADKLREEMDRRRLRFTPIDWPEDGCR